MLRAIGGGVRETTRVHECQGQTTGGCNSGLEEAGETLKGGQANLSWMTAWGGG